MNIDAISSKVGSLVGAGRSTDAPGAMWTTPWRYRTDDGRYVRDSKVWAYFKLPVTPITWEDSSTRLDAGYRIHAALRDLADSSGDHSMGISLLANPREIHLVTIHHDALPEIPDSPSAALREFHAESLRFIVPHKTLLLGVKLRQKVAASLRTDKGVKGLIAAGRELGTKVLGESVPDLAPFDADFEKVREILRSYGATVPDRGDLERLEGWINMGAGLAVPLYETTDSLYVGEHDHIVMDTVAAFEEPRMVAPWSPWALDALTHPTGPHVVSIRAELQPASVATSRVRRNERRMLAQMEEEQATGDLEKKEDSIAFRLAKDFEDFVATSKQPILSSTSIVMGRRVADGVDDTFYEDMYNSFGIRIRPLPLRQHAAFMETLPTASERVNPYLQDVSLTMIAHCGINGWSNIGDESGCLVGLVDQFSTPCWFDLFAASRESKPAGTAIFGDSGSGKTYLMQALATQATLAGYQTIFINPKGDSTLRPFAELVGGNVITMSKVGEGGLDPFGYSEDPEQAASIATQFLSGILASAGVSGQGITTQQETALAAGLRRGALAGARCVGDALKSVANAELRELIDELAEGHHLVRLAISRTPLSPGALQRGLTLIEFDQKLHFPNQGKKVSEYTLTERQAVGIIRLISQISLEMLRRAKGGAFFLDEAWTLLESQEGLAILQELGREGRSRGIAAVFATQRVNDLIRDGVNMESHLSRVFVMKLNEASEQRAALQLCGLRPTPERLEFNRRSNPQPPRGDTPGRAAWCIHRDLAGRHSAVMVGPFPRAAHEAFLTNPDEDAALGLDDAD